MNQTAAVELPVAIPAEVIDFAASQGVSDYLYPVLEMTRRVFPSSGITMSMDEDPEIAGDRHIVLSVDMTNLGVEEIVKTEWQWCGELFHCCPATQVWVFRLGAVVSP